MAVMLDDGTWGEGGEEVHGLYYDHYPILNTRTGAQRLFTAVPGDSRFGAQLSYADTNNISKGQVPNGWKFEFHRIELAYVAIAIRNDAAIQSIIDYLRVCVMRIVVEGKYKLFEALGQSFMSDWQVVHVPTAAGNNVAPPGVSIVRGAIDLKIPVVLQEQTPWYWEIDQIAAPAAGLNGDFLSPTLEGKLIHRG